MTTAHMIVGAFVALLTASSAAAQTCSQGNDVSGDTRARRDSAMRYLIAVNAAEGRAQRQTGRYTSLSELSGLPSVPVGFVPKLLFDQWSYVISLKDFFDPCEFAFFSDDRGMVYEAYPQAPRTPTSQEVPPDDSETLLGDSVTEKGR